MRRGVLAGVVAVAAVEAEIGEIGEIGFGESSALLHRRKNRAIPLAVAAGVADHHLPRALLEEFRPGHGAPPPALQFYLRPSRQLDLIRRDSLAAICCPPSLPRRQICSLPAGHRA